MTTHRTRLRALSTEVDENVEPYWVWARRPEWLNERAARAAEMAAPRPEPSHAKLL
jgi:hypothetical protein